MWLPIEESADVRHKFQVGRFEALCEPPLRKRKTSAGRSKRIVDAAREKARRSEGKTFRGTPLRKAGTSKGAAVAAAKMNRPPDSKRASDRRSGIQPTADSAEERMEPEPIRRKGEWWRSRFSGCADASESRYCGRQDSFGGRFQLDPLDPRRPPQIVTP